MSAHINGYDPPEWTLTMLDEPSPIPPRSPFRCDRCNRMTDEGKWVSRGIGRGHVVGVCADEKACRKRRRRFWR